MAKLKQLRSTVQSGTAQGWARADSLPVLPWQEQKAGKWLAWQRGIKRINSSCWCLHGSPFFFFQKHWTWFGKWAWKKTWQWLLQSITIHCKRSIKCIRNTLLCLCWGEPTCLRGTQLLENPQQLNQSAKKHISRGKFDIGSAEGWLKSVMFFFLTGISKLCDTTNASAEWQQHPFVNDGVDSRATSKESNGAPQIPTYVHRFLSYAKRNCSEQKKEKSRKNPLVIQALVCW